MAWMRLEVSYIDHPKFLALTDGAFRLWHEGKSYCEKHLTDGMMPLVAVTGFRHFTERRSTELQTAIPGFLAALWEQCAVGLRMHDYLDHNDARDVALKRIAGKKEENDRKRQNQAAFRARKKSERNRENAQTVTGNEPIVSDRFVGDRTETTTTTTPSPSSSPSPSPSTLSIKAKSDHAREPLNGSGVMTGALPREHMSHAACDATYSRCVPDAVHRKLVSALAPKFANDRGKAGEALTAWYGTVWSALPTTFVMGDAFRFWQARFDEAFASKPATVGDRKFTIPSAEATASRYLRPETK